MSCPYHGSVAYCCVHKRATEISLKGLFIDHDSPHTHRAMPARFEAKRRIRP